MNIKKLNISDLHIHEYAKLTPRMIPEQFEALKIDLKDNGQLEPIRVCKGYCYDGRHRIAALKDLGIDVVDAIVDDGLSNSDIKSQVLSLENRRHQTPTQLAIMAYKEYVMLSANADTKESQGSIASRFGITRTNLAEVKSLAERSPDIIEHLFNGNKLNIGSATAPNLTNNVRAINAWLKSDREIRMADSDVGFKFTVDEAEIIDDASKDFIARYGIDVAIEVSKRIIAKYSGR